ncbi:MAG TPA: helix-turn-helix domain-containing protein [Actinocrinis sp.]|uniref:ArsR/SmtB family transcription factor n=1 Tax=Actinocrinis sp. TaxID=1920516 RepID=UPI002D2BEF30|nr:helix-turn-helix domain-containing protein [Actinocrinis sp.]HZU58887.1 helix-turn-helix domain-containing protein [Actinocrinis sp.]
MATDESGSRGEERSADPEQAAVTAPPLGYVEERAVTDLETLRILADPLRLAIIGAFPSDAARRRPMSVKEIAERIDEGQTKLYRHVKKLEDVGLIYVAETRVVSGIIEKRYLPAQKRLVFSGTLLGQQAEPEDFTDTVEALMDAVRDRLRTEIRAGRVQLSPPPEGPDLSPQIGSIRVNMTLERYLKLQAAVLDLIDNIGPSDEGPDTLVVQLHAVLFASTEPADSELKKD